MLQGQYWPMLGKKTLKQTSNDLDLTAKDIFNHYAPESSSYFHRLNRQVTTQFSPSGKLLVQGLQIKITNLIFSVSWILSVLFFVIIIDFKNVDNSIGGHSQRTHLP